VTEGADKGFDWLLPRWREPDDAQADIERDRRFHDEAAPGQTGAIDGDRSIPSQRDDGATDPAKPQGPTAPEARRAVRRKRKRRT
jgi:hypothetical protein